MTQVYPKDSVVLRKYELCRTSLEMVTKNRTSCFVQYCVQVMALVPGTVPYSGWLMTHQANFFLMMVKTMEDRNVQYRTVRYRTIVHEQKEL